MLHHINDFIIIASIAIHIDSILYDLIQIIHKCVNINMRIIVHIIIGNKHPQTVCLQVDLIILQEVIQSLRAFRRAKQGPGKRREASSH